MTCPIHYPQRNYIIFIPVRDHDHLPLGVAQTAPELLCGIVTEASDPSLCVFLCPKESLTALSVDKG